MEGRKYKGTAECWGSVYTQRNKTLVTTEHKTENSFFLFQVHGEVAL